jgi:hypothetical protein
MPDPTKNVKVDKTAEEISKEQAESLGLTGRKLTAALAALAAHDARPEAERNAEERERLLARAVDATTYFIVQREACGLRDPEYVYEFYSVPREVIVRIGARVPGRV